MRQRLATLVFKCAFYFFFFFFFFYWKGGGGGERSNTAVEWYLTDYLFI